MLLVFPHLEVSFELDRARFNPFCVLGLVGA